MSAPEVHALRTFLRAALRAREAVDGERLLDVALAAGAREALARCDVTGNLLGTDTWSAGHACTCRNCAAYLQGKREALESLAAWADHAPPIVEAATIAIECRARAQETP